MSEMEYAKQIEKWDVIEVNLLGRSDGNPFTDYTIHGIFSGNNEQVTVDGFYDGGGHYIVRFMPSFTGQYTFEISGNFSPVTHLGSFEVVSPSANNHGPVRVANGYHFVYEDGRPYYSIGTTCYVWTHQDQALQETTLEALKNSAFNKIRFCIFPKHYVYNFNEPISYPFEGRPMDSSVLTKENFNQYNGKAPGNDWDFKRFNPVHFQMIEKRIVDLMSLGIEADIIVMHPYDRWGFSEMDQESDDRYWRYVIARFSAYRNVWWSLANEFDFMKKKTIKDWERYASIIGEKDVYNRLTSIHSAMNFYDFSRPWISHCSIQRQGRLGTAEHTDVWRERYKKPVVLDEISYEGNIQHAWGNISGEEMVRRFWEGTIRGGYAGHGETYMSEDGLLWWSHGGVLKGDSSPRFKFLKEVLDNVPGLGLTPIKAGWDDVAATTNPVTHRGEYYIYYYGINRPSFRTFHYDDAYDYEVRVLDTWLMTNELVGRFKGKFNIQLPGKEYMAIEIRRL